MDRSRILGQYFTPKPVVDLCYRFLTAIDPDTDNPRVIDPSCGECAFLSHARTRGITPPERLFGVEKDPEIGKCWDSAGQLCGMNLHLGDGLLPNGKFADKSFDWVVGNPPFGTRWMEGSTVDYARTIESQFDVWRNGENRSGIERYPVEILFLERFLQLAKPSGYAAIIVPDGILANDRLSYVREWMGRHAEVKAVVSLPQDLFQRTGASSKSSILLMRKLAGSDEGPRVTFMAALESLWPLEKGAPLLAGIFEDWAANGTQGVRKCAPWLTFAIEEPSGGEKLDPAYHHPGYAENLRVLEASGITIPLGSLIERTTYGQVGRRKLAKSGIKLLTPSNFVTTSDGYVTRVDTEGCDRFVAPGSYNDPARSRLKPGDLLLVNSGVGCTGRTGVFYSDEPCNISQHINLIRVNGIEPEYLAVYLQTSYARLQIDRVKSGVGPCGLNFNRIKSLLIPILPEETRREIAERYRRVTDADPADAEQMIRTLVEELEGRIAEVES